MRAGNDQSAEKALQETSGDLHETLHHSELLARAGLDIRPMMARQVGPMLPRLVGQTLSVGTFNRVAATRHTGLGSWEGPPDPHPLASESTAVYHVSKLLRVQKLFGQSGCRVH